MDKKFFFQILGLIIVILVATALTFNPQFIPNLGSRNVFPSPSANTQTVASIVDGASSQVKAQVNIEVADTKEKRGIGLGGRTSLPPENGMLFIMEQRGKPVFWMKGMMIPLDFIWIDGDRVVDILQNVQPPVAGTPDQNLQLYSPVVDVNRVLEVNAGYIAAKGIKIGDRIQLSQVNANR